MTTKRTTPGSAQPAAETPAATAADTDQPAAQTPAVTTETTAALHGTPAAEPTAEPRPFLLSEGVRNDLEIWGQATDPATGNVVKRDKDTGKVTVTDRTTGKVTELPGVAGSDR